MISVLYELIAVVLLWLSDFSQVLLFPATCCTSARNSPCSAVCLPAHSPRLDDNRFLAPRLQ